MPGPSGTGRRQPRPEPLAAIALDWSERVDAPLRRWARAACAETTGAPTTGACMPDLVLGPDFSVLPPGQVA